LSISWHPQDPLNCMRLLHAFLWLSGWLVLFWWPLSHWVYPDWYYHLLGFENYPHSLDPALVKIIGTLGGVSCVGRLLCGSQPCSKPGFDSYLDCFQPPAGGDVYIPYRLTGFSSAGIYQCWPLGGQHCRIDAAGSTPRGLGDAAGLAGRTGVGGHFKKG
jgi:hypothetical protein